MYCVTVIASDNRMVQTQIDSTDGRFWRFDCRSGPPLHFIRFSIPPALPQLRTSPRYLIVISLRLTSHFY